MNDEGVLWQEWTVLSNLYIMAEPTYRVHYAAKGKDQRNSLKFATFFMLHIEACVIP